MQTRIAKKFIELKKAKKKAFIPFITVGDPDLKTTEQLIPILEKSGASMIELGVPFSDPMADGPTIQRANERALKNNIHLTQIFSLVKKIRIQSQIPIILMGYYNPVLQYGLKNFARDCHQSGVDGLIIVDLPVEESQPLKKELKNKPVDLIYLLTPTSEHERIQLVAKHGRGFVYYVSFTGTTGALKLNIQDVKKNVARIRSQIKLPINVGFGISTPAHVRSVSSFADGVVVGSAIVKIIEKFGKGKKLLSEIETHVKKMIRPLG